MVGLWLSCGTTNIQTKPSLEHSLKRKVETIGVHKMSRVWYICCISLADNG